MVDDFDGDAAGKGFGEGTRGVAVERGPGVFIDLGLEGGLEGAVIVSKMVISFPFLRTHKTIVLLIQPETFSYCCIIGLTHDDVG